MTRYRWVFAILASLSLAATVADAADWTTYRGNSQRTGNIDGKAGPTKPQVLWAYASKDHFVAAPVPVEKRLLVSGFSGFNTPALYCLDIDPKAGKRVAWSKAVPLLKLPTVSSPAVADGKVIFGDGMHQTDGAELRCLRQDTGRLLWQ